MPQPYPSIWGGLRSGIETGMEFDLRRKDREFRKQKQAFERDRSMMMMSMELMANDNLSDKSRLNSYKSFRSIWNKYSPRSPLEDFTTWPKKGNKLSKKIMDTWQDETLDSQAKQKEIAQHILEAGKDAKGVDATAIQKILAGDIEREEKKKKQEDERIGLMQGIKAFRGPEGKPLVSQKFDTETLQKLRDIEIEKRKRAAGIGKDTTTTPTFKIVKDIESSTGWSYKNLRKPDAKMIHGAPAPKTVGTKDTPTFTKIEGIAFEKFVSKGYDNLNSQQKAIVDKKLSDPMLTQATRIIMDDFRYKLKPASERVKAIFDLYEQLKTQQGTLPYQQGKKQLTEDIAKQILKDAGGDKEKARKIAKDRGYEF